MKPRHKNYVDFEVYGDYALFSDVLTRSGGEKSSFSIPSYEALKGILKSVYTKPTIVWHIEKCRVMNRIQSYRKGMRPIRYNDGRNDLAYYTYLRDVRYQVRAYFEWNDNRPELAMDRNEHKHHNIAKRMIERGGRRDCFLGTRECYAYVKPCVFGEGKGYYDNSGEIMFGLTYAGIIYADEAVHEEDQGKMTVTFWDPVMKDGVLEFVQPEDIVPEMKRHIREMEIKPFGKELKNFIGAEEFEGGEEFELGE